MSTNAVQGPPFLRRAFQNGTALRPESSLRWHDICTCSSAGGAMTRLLRVLLALMALALLGTADAPARVSARPTLTRVLFLYGSVPPGTDPNDMVRIGNTGRNGYAQLAAMLLVEQGHNVTELADTDPAVNPLTPGTLALYDLLVLGSNNRRFSLKEAAAV